MDSLEKQLKKLQSISPDASFASSSRASILSTRKEYERKVAFFSVVKNVGLSLSITTAAFALLVAVNFLRVNNPVTSAVASLDEIEAEKQVIDQNVVAAKNEADFLNSSNRKTSMALTEAAGSSPSHLNPTVINKEIEKIDSVDFDKKDEIKNLLDKASK